MNSQTQSASLAIGVALSHILALSQTPATGSGSGRILSQDGCTLRATVTLNLANL